MGPKKDDKKKAGLAVAGGGPQSITISEDEFNEAKQLPHIKDFIFVNLFAFKMTRNESRLKAAVAKEYTYTNPEEPGYSEEKAVKYRCIEKAQLCSQAVARGWMTAEEAADIGKMDPERRRRILAQATVESIIAYQ